MTYEEPTVELLLCYRVISQVFRMSFSGHTETNGIIRSLNKNDIMRVREENTWFVDRDSCESEKLT